MFEATELQVHSTFWSSQVDRRRDRAAPEQTHSEFNNFCGRSRSETSASRSAAQRPAPNQRSPTRWARAGCHRSVHAAAHGSSPILASCICRKHR